MKTHLADVFVVQQDVVALNGVSQRVQALGTGHGFVPPKPFPLVGAGVLGGVY
tara:strand:- start:184 stop:342 length:159 start_codon:yes stop_codon:yes gene_type:complete